MPFCPRSLLKITVTLLMALPGVARAQSGVVVDIASPTNGTIFPAPTDMELIAGVASVNDAGVTVEFFDGLQSIGIASNGLVVDPPGGPGLPPGGLEYMIDWTNQTVGIHVLTATATDTNGNTFQSAPVTIFVGSTTNSSSVVTITQPTNTETFTAPTNIQFDVSVYDPDGDITSVGFVAAPGGTGVLPDFVISLGSVSNWTSPTPLTKLFTFVWSNALTGTWLVEASAGRKDGLSAGSDSVLITVNEEELLTIGILSPFNGESFPGPTNIDLIARVTSPNSDSAAYVEFFDGSNLLGTVTNEVSVLPPYTPGAPASTNKFLAYVFDWTNQTSGNHVINAIATDTNGNAFRSVPVPIFVGNVSNVTPTVTITQPPNGATFSAPTNIEFDVSIYDPSGEVDAVSFVALPAPGLSPIIYVIYLGSVTNWTSLDPSTRNFTFVWSNAIAGTWSVQAGARGSDGAVVGSTSVLITVEKTYLLSVDIANPTNGTTYPAPTNIELIAGVVANNDTAAYVEFFDGLLPLGVASNWVVVDPPGSPGLPAGSHAYFFDWTNQSLGCHVLTATVTDTNGITFRSEPVTVFIGSPSNFPPLVRITSPPNMASFNAPVNVPLVAFAQAPFGGVQSVEFFAGTNSLGFGQSLPVAVPLPVPGPIPGPVSGPIIVSNFFGSNIFVLIWSNAPPGAYTLTALATDNDGGSATSAPVNITIEPALPPPTNQLDVVSIVATDPIAIASTNCWPWLGGPLTWSNWGSPTAIWTWQTNCGPIDASFTVRRFGSTNSELTVDYSVSGTATNGIDYAALPGTVTIPAGQCEAAIPILPLASSISNFASTVILTLIGTTNEPPEYTMGFPSSAEAIIIDNLAPQPLAGGTLLPDRSFHMWMNGPDGAWFHIDYTTNLADWTPICTNQVVYGSIDFIDPGAGNSTARMYRAVPISGPPRD